MSLIRKLSSKLTKEEIGYLSILNFYINPDEIIYGCDLSFCLKNKLFTILDIKGETIILKTGSIHLFEY